jgi:uncharacterized repeat protein (TIGR01451 family)
MMWRYKDNTRAIAYEADQAPITKNINNMNYINNRHFCFILLIISLLPLSRIQADGSKDLYPAGLSAYRAFLRSTSNATATATENWPFANRGTHYVYAKAGERITLASSAQSGTNNNILLYGPTGTQITLTKSSGDGNIPNRAAELAGPSLYNVTPSGDRYKPIYYNVQTEGIYRVEFLALGTSDPGSTVNADGNWGNTNSSSSGIAAWDISVINSSNSGFVSGRVYTNVLNLSTGTSNPTSNGFRGIVYVRTKDGYTYRINNNGSNGMYFTFFVNNNGFVDISTQLPIYKSLNNSTATYLNGRVHNPNNADKDTHLTHKMFYTLPDTNLPPTAPVPVTSSGGAGASGWSAGTTWLKAEPIIPGVSTPILRGADGLIGQVSNKGGYIEFEADVQGNYTIEIISTGTPAFVNRTITGQASAGTNKVFWDGKDGNNNPLPAGTVPAKVTVQLQGAEVHFPFFDVEYNSTGIIIELLAHASLPSIVPTSDIVYWNDTDVTSNNPSNPKNNSHLPPTNSTGISSNSNGHKWGNNFGNEKSIDTWTFITGEKKEVITDIDVRKADLKVSDIKVNGANSATVYLGDEITYTVKVKNDGPSDVLEAPFAFTLPEGLTGTGIPVFDGNGCGTQAVAVSYDTAKRQYTSKLNLPNGCEITYTFKANIGDTAEPGSLKADATILRPNDVTDPDATNISDSANPLPPADAEDPLDLTKWYIPPTDPYFECANNFPVGNPQRGICNNIRDISVTLIRQADLTIEKTVSNPKPKVGDIVTFTLKITNNGPHAAKNIIITDIVPNGYTIGTINDGGTNSSGTITWNSTTTPAKLGELAKDAVTTVSFQATVKASGNYVNTGRVTGDGEDPNPDNNEDTERVSLNNYWHGTIDNDWSKDGNWTANYVPGPGEDVEFATSANNNGNPADKDLHLDKDRIIGDLINASDKNLLVTTGNELIINGEVKDGNPATGTIIVKSATDEASGTLLFTDPSKNQQVRATVEFYNKAYECATCGFYRKQWQYFGIPVQSSGFPYLNPQVETVNQWVEPFNGDKWQPAPYAPDTDLKAFKGYEMTSSSNVLPTHIYSFTGSLNVGDATVSLTRTVNVNYPGMNLLGNSFTAAIPITSSAINLGGVILNDNTAYLFNTGTRDQWRKLNGGTATGIAAGQYQAVPFNLSGQAGIPDRILSMHTFMLNVATPGSIILKYDELIKNELNSSTTMPWKSAVVKSSPAVLPHIVMDVIGNGSADRVWLFEQADATTGFDNGWDGYKMKEGDLIQAYISGSDQSDYQIATVPEIVGTIINVNSGLNENYLINLSVTPEVESRNLFLRDFFTGHSYPVINNAEYVITGMNNSNNNRFKIMASTSDLVNEDTESSLINIYVRNGIITIDNQSEEDCSATVYDLTGRLVANKQARKNEITEFTDILHGQGEIYIVKVAGKTKSVNKTDRVLLK